jgi:DNA polymerase elongation subunit (family B)
MTIEIAQDAAHLCTQYLKSPMELSYEKTLMPFILVRKKKYVGMLYETDPNKGKMKIMGLSVKRRDTCDYFKDVYGGVLTILMSGRENTIQEAITFVEKSLNELVEGRVPMDKLSITKALRSYYKNPQSIAHKVLADRIGKRDPGNKPKAGDRIRYVCIDIPNSKKALMGERIETPEFIVEQKLKIDYNYYITNQLMRPLQQLFGLCLEQIWELNAKKNSGRIKNYRSEMEKLQKDYPDLEVFVEKKEKVTSAKVKLLLFDAVLKKIDNDRQGIQPITSYFHK